MKLVAILALVILAINYQMTDGDVLTLMNVLKIWEIVHIIAQIQLGVTIVLATLAIT